MRPVSAQGFPQRAAPPREAATDVARIAWVDYAKGICIVLVVMMHSTLGVQEAAGATGFMDYAVAFARPFRMPDFFLISGLFIGLVIDRDWRTYLDRKVVHFAYFYVLWLLIQGAFKWPSLAMAEGPLAVAEAFALALIEPFGTLWFIYLLPIFFVSAKLLRGAPPVLVLAVGAMLESTDLHTGWIVIDEFASRWIYFLAGWYGARYAFALADKAAERPRLALVGLAAWAGLNAAAVGTGVATLPGISLALGLAGAGAVIATAALMARFGIAEAMRHAGENSIVVYLAFFLPMAVTRTVLLKTGVVADVGLVSLLVTAVAVVAPLILHVLVRQTSPFKYLFVRPDWARLDRRAPRLQLAR
jgi:uncharacterized membrane protein YcfT